MLPLAVTVHGVLVQSETLAEQSRVVGDERTLGLNIASFMNDFTVRRIIIMTRIII